MKLVKPSLDLLPSYHAAMLRGWSPFTTRAAPEELEQIAKDPLAFVAGLENHHPTDIFTLPDGSQTPRLPNFRRWMWDGEFCGNVNFRYQHGTSDIPEDCMGHIGYSVVPWKQGKGYAKLALAQAMEEARMMGLTYLELHTDLDNIPSQRVILSNGGTCVGERDNPPAFGGGRVFVYKVTL